MKEASNGGGELTQTPTGQSESGSGVNTDQLPSEHFHLDSEYVEMSETEAKVELQSEQKSLMLLPQQQKCSVNWISQLKT